MDLSLRNLIQIGRRWWWLLILAPLIAGGSAYYSVSHKQNLYSATATVQINPPSQTSAANFTNIDNSQTFVETYRQLATTSDVLQPVIDTLKLPLTVSELRSKVSTSTVTNTQLVHIAVSDPDPELAATIANQIATQFSAYSKQRTEALSSPYRTALDQQIKDTQSQINATQSQIDTLEAGADAQTPDVQNKLATLRSTLDDLNTTYGNLIVTANQMDLASAGAQTTVLVAQPATPPSVPYAPKTKLYTLLGIFAGLCIAIGAIGLYEYLDNTVKITTNFPEVAGAPLLSVIGTIPKLNGGHDQLYVLERPKSNMAESIRLLRTNIEFAASSREISALAVTSAGPGDGKSTVTANLGVAMAQSGFSAVVIDADLRRPSQHKIFGVRNDRGLTTLLTHPDLAWRSVASEVIEGSLYMVPSGPIPPNPADLLSSERFQQLLDQVHQQVDIVLIDTPPVLAVSDPLIISPATDGVLLVCRAGVTRIDAVARAAESFPESVRRVGIVLNQQERNRGDGYYYYYYSGYYGPDEGPPPPSAPDSAGKSGRKWGRNPRPQLEPQSVTRSE